MMSHYSIYITTATLLLLSPSALAQSVFTQGAVNLQPENNSASRLAQVQVPAPQAQQDLPDWQDHTNPDWYLSQEDLGLQFAPGQYHGNRGPASEETGIQLLLFSQ